MTHRLFISLEIPADIRAELNSTVKKIAVSIPEGKNYRWESKDKYHLTLKFIGDVEDSLLTEIKSTLNYLNGKKGYSGEISGFGLFPEPKRPKVLWAGIKISPDINELVVEMDDRLHQSGIIKEIKKFKPHITLLRIKENYDISFLNYFFSYKFETKSFPLNRIVLYESLLQKSGSIYKPLENYKLI